MSFSLKRETTHNFTQKVSSPIGNYLHSLQCIYITCGHNNNVIYIYLWYRDGVVLYFSSYLNVTGCCDLVVDMLWSSCINTRHRWSETIESSWICHDIANAFLPVGCWWICHPDFYLKFEVTSIKDRVKIIVDHKKIWQIISANFQYICLQKIVLQKTFLNHN